ncbi:potassium transporter TrkG [Aggregatilineales bacterium SYSU G02658]
MRQKEYLRSRYRAIVGYTGVMMSLLGGLHLVPLIVVPFFTSEAQFAPVFLLTSLLLFIPGYLAYRRFQPRDSDGLTLTEGMVVIVLLWLAAPLASTLPLMHITGLNFAQAVFESISGWTATGLTLLVPEDMPRIILMHRSLMQVWGAAGFAILALSVLAASLGAGISAAEGRTDQLAPNVRRSASIVLYIYVGYLVFGVLALRLAGMGWFDAVNHAFTAVATGGFSTKNRSIAHFDSALIEAIIILLMFLGSVNFLIAYTAIRGKWRDVVRSGEIRIMFGIAVPSVLLVLLVTLNGLYGLEREVRMAVFEVMAAITTTGFSISTYADWNEFGLAMLALLMLIGGGVGSTAGGIKLLRVYILYKAVTWEIRKAFMPQHMVNEPAIRQGDRRDLLSDKQTRQVAAFLVMFLIVLISGIGAMMMAGYPLMVSVFEVSSAIAGAGLSIGQTQPTMPEAMMWSQSAVMLMGRLEFFAVIIGLTKLTTDLFQLLKPKKRSRTA